MRKQLYQYAILKHTRHSSAEGDTEGDTEVILKPGEYVLAADEAEVKILAHRTIPAEHLNHLDQLEVVVQPFCGATTCV